MGRQNWKEIRGAAAPETIERAELKMKTMVASIDGQDRPDAREAREENRLGSGRAGSIGVAVEP